VKNLIVKNNVPNKTIVDSRLCPCCWGWLSSKERGSFGGEFGHPVVTSGDFVV